MNKKVLISVGSVVLVFAIIIWRLAVNLDGIVAGVIERVGTDVLKTEVKVSGMVIDLREGKAAIAGLTIANPDGYSRSNLFEMEGIEVDIAINSLGKKVLVIESIQIENPQILYEGDEGGSSNLQTLLNNIGSDSSATETVEGEDLMIIIDRLEFSGGLVKATSPVKPGQVANIKLPAVSMTGIGKKHGGVTADVVAEKIMRKLVDEIIRAVAKAEVNKLIEEKAEGWLDKLKGDK